MVDDQERPGLPDEHYGTYVRFKEHPTLAKRWATRIELGVSADAAV